jgi:hypothetical protein
MRHMCSLATHQYCIANIFLDVFDFLFTFSVGKSIYVKDAHLLYNCRFSRLTSAEKQQSMRCPIDLLISHDYVISYRLQKKQLQFSI